MRDQCTAVLFNLLQDGRDIADDEAEQLAATAPVAAAALAADAAALCAVAGAPPRAADDLLHDAVVVGAALLLQLVRRRPELRAALCAAPALAPALAAAVARLRGDGAVANRVAASYAAHLAAVLSLEGEDERLRVGAAVTAAFRAAGRGLSARDAVRPLVALADQIQEFVLWQSAAKILTKEALAELVRVVRDLAAANGFSFTPQRDGARFADAPRSRSGSSGGGDG